MTVTITLTECQGEPLVSSIDIAPPRRSRSPASPSSSLPYGFELLIRRYLDGKPADFSRIPLDLNDLSPFTQAIIDAARSLPRGRTISYADLAKRAGHAGATRAAASVMRKNRFPLIVPCHRIIRADGAIGGFMGEKGGWPIVIKRRLLELEGVSLPRR